MSGQVGRPRKSFAEQSFGDLAWSLLFLLALVGVVWGVGSLITDEPERTARPVDYSGQLSAARDLADYPVLAPEGLGRGWVATSVDLQESGGTVRWHLGFLTPAQEYVGLEQADSESPAMAARYLGGLSPAGSVTVGSRSWKLYEGEVDQALVRRQGDVITIVVGTAATDVLVDFAASLT